MTIYFAWVGVEESFNPKIHCRDDQQVFRLDIQQREGGFALARIAIANPKCGLLNYKRQRHCFIAYHNTLLFKGRVVGMPVQVNGEIVHLDFSAEPEDSQQRLLDLQKQLKQAPYWDELFVSEEGQDDPVEVLEARSALYYWCRTTGEVSISDIFNGQHHVNLTDKFFRNSLKFAVNEVPLASISIEVIAEWTQRAQGECDIGHLIEEKFTRGLVNTLTGVDLAVKWWRTGEKVGHTNYKVVQSDLQEIEHLNPQTSSAVWSGEDANERSKIWFKRHWFKTYLRLGWSYKQRRREVACFTLNHATQPLAQNNGKTRRLRLYLQNIVGENHHWRPYHRYTPKFHVVYKTAVYTCIKRHQSSDVFADKFWQQIGRSGHISEQAHRASFFLTDRGMRAINHAIEIARSHLAASARAISIKIVGEFDLLHQVTTDHSITIQDDRLPGGKVTGKITAYRIYVDGKTGHRHVEVTLAVAIGAGAKSEDRVDATETYVDNTFCAQPYQAFTKWQLQQPKGGIIHPLSLSAFDIVRKVTVENDAKAQNQHLLQNQYPANQDLKSVLSEVPTNVRIDLADIGAVETLHHEINIDLHDAWSAPKQINLLA